MYPKTREYGGASFVDKKSTYEWERRGASFVDKKSTVTFTRIIHGEYFLESDLLNKGKLPTGNW